MTNICAITPTRERYQSFERCMFYMDRQTRGPDKWIVVNDGKAKIKPPQNAVYIDRKHESRDGPASQYANLLAGLKEAQGCDWITIFTDDDWYHPDHLLQLSYMAEHHPDRLVVGQRDIRAWHAKMNGFAFGPSAFPSMSTIMFQESQIPGVCQALEDYMKTGRPGAMTAFWKKVPKDRRWTWSDPITMVTIAGMPGTNGITERQYHRDDDGLILREWVGDDDAAWYMEGVVW